MTHEDVAGLVLAGGRSRRFGREKAGVSFRGKPLVAWALERLDGVCAEVAVSTAPESEAARLAAGFARPVLADPADYPRGPLAGIAAGLGWAAAAGRTWLATLPCDAPLVSVETLTALVAAAREAGGAFAVANDGPHALVAVWPTAALATLSDCLTAGEHPAVREALTTIGAKPVRFEDARVFRNVNTPSDLAEIEDSSPR